MQIIKQLKKLYWIYRFVNVRGILTTMRYSNISSEARVNKHCSFKNLKYMQSGRRLFVDDYAQIFINRASVTITPRLEVGENVKIGRYASIGCSHSIILEDFVRLAPHVHITDRNHSYDNIEMPITLQPIVFAPVHIKAHTWLGYGSQIMPGVTIGRHCVIAAGSIVTKDIPDYCVAAGVPAKVIKRYNHDTQKWESVRKGVTMHEFQVPENIVPNYNKDLQDKLGGGNSL